MIRLREYDLPCGRHEVRRGLPRKHGDKATTPGPGEALGGDTAVASPRGMSTV